MNKLTVIIPFLNEGQEIGNTVKNLRETAGNEVDILLINDASYDAYDYEQVARTYRTAYIRNPERLGVAASRDLGVQRIQTPYFLLLDGHMRFYQSDWHEILAKEIEQNERALYCCYCLPLNDRCEVQPHKTTFGAAIDLDFRSDNPHLLTVRWVQQDLTPGSDRGNIACVLGAAYAASKAYWTRLRGLAGLRMYGSDEAYISMKVWMEGGSCILLKDLKAGHIFRKKFPYPVESADTLFNRLLITETLFPPFYRNEVYNNARKTQSSHLRQAMELLAESSAKIQELQAHYRQIGNRTFESFLEFNERIVREAAALQQAEIKLTKS